MQTGYASIAVDATPSAAAADQSQNDASRPQHPQRCTAAAQSTPPQPARRKDANSPTSVIDARDDKQFAPLGAAQNHAVARAALLGVALTLTVLLLMLLALGSTYPALVGPGLLALGFGLRHGVDCDHIAAIDNVARKLSAARTRRETYPIAARASHRRRRRENQREGFWRHWCVDRAQARRPAALVGLWFSLGHSTVVVLLCAAVSTGSAYARAHVASCVEIKILRRVRAESSHRPPRHQRDACSMAWRCRFLAARPSQDGRVHPTHWLISTQIWTADAAYFSNALDSLVDSFNGSKAANFSPFGSSSASLFGSFFLLSSFLAASCAALASLSALRFAFAALAFSLLAKALASFGSTASWGLATCVEIKFYGAFVVLHAIDATPARWRGGAGSSPLDGAGTAASSPRNDLMSTRRTG